MADYVNLAAAALACIGALVGLRQFLRFRTHRDRLSEIGQSFTRLANGLGAGTQIERLSAAALLPKFFDPKSEFGMKRSPYAGDAARLMVAVLKTEPTGVVQKTLADGLAGAPSLLGADFQRANLRNCYWGRRRDGTAVSAPKADFFRADLSAASLKGADLRKAVFMGAQLVTTVLKEADLRDCNFNSANLRGASFDGALLAGASFVGAHHIPGVITELLDANGKYTGDVVPTSTSAPSDSHRPRRVFLSRPSQCDGKALVMVAQIMRGVTASGLELVTFPPDEYGTGAPLDEVKQRIGSCDAVIILGVPQIEADLATLRVGTIAEKTIKNASLATPWNQIEAGVAAALDKPLLIVRDDVTEGIFEIGDQPHTITIIDAGVPDELTRLDAVVAEWAARLIPAAA